jgi:co-chaperonin GroES (HSP10)
MTVEPVASHVLIQILQTDDENEIGGVHLPQIDYRMRQFGKILSIGLNVDPELKVGDVVCFKSGVGTFIDHEVDGKTEKCILMEFAHIIYIMEDYEGKSHRAF